MTTENDRDRSQEESTETPNRQVTKTRIVAIQALMYIAAYLLTWTFLIFTFFTEDTIAVQFCKIVFQPLQGFFNMLSSLFTTISKKDALRVFIFVPQRTPDVIISSIAMMHDNKLREMCNRGILWALSDHMRQDLEGNEFSSIDEDCGGMN